MTSGKTTHFARVRRARLACGSLLALSAFALSATPALARQPIAEAAMPALQRAARAMDARDCPLALKAVSPIIAQRDFATLADPQRAPFLLISLICQAQAGSLDIANDHAMALTAMPSPPDMAWSLRLGVQLDANRGADAVTTLEAMQQSAPGILAGIDRQWIFALNRKLVAAHDDATRARFLAFVSSPTFAPAQDDIAYDGMRMAHARMLARSGDLAGAKSQMTQVLNGVALRDASLDPDLRSAFATDFDLRALIEGQIVQLEAMAERRPGLLATPLAIAEAQRLIGKPEAALATLEAVRPEDVLAKHFSDRDTQYSWWCDSLARTYEQLGRYEEGVAAYRKAIDDGENGGANVSQVINLGYLHHRYGHDDAALTTLAVFEGMKPDSASPYGMMEYHLARGCAAQGAGKADIAAADLAYAKAHAADHPEALTDLQLCLGRIDEAAASMVARLDSPDQRVTALGQLSDYVDPPAVVPPAPFAAGLAALRQRADVQAAIARAGGIRRFNVVSPTL